jgi:hypothetical protein
MSRIFLVSICIIYIYNRNMLGLQWQHTSIVFTIGTCFVYNDNIHQLYFQSEHVEFVIPSSSIVFFKLKHIYFFWTVSYNIIVIFRDAYKVLGTLIASCQTCASEYAGVIMASCINVFLNKYTSYTTKCDNCIYNRNMSSIISTYINYISNQNIIAYSADMYRLHL